MWTEVPGSEHREKGGFMMWINFILLVCLLGTQSVAQQVFPNNPQYKAESELLILRFVPGDKKAKIFLAGNKVADLDFNKDAKILSVVMLNETKKEVLKLNRNGDFYEVESSKEFPSAYQIVVKTEVRGKPQEMKFKINQTKP